MSTVTTLRESLAARRAAAAEHRRLERELAAYRTPGERLELDAILARHTDEETRAVRGILAAQDAATAASRTPFSPAA